MGSIRDSAERSALIDRVNEISPHSQRMWGSMSVGEMVAHISDAFRVSLGDLRVASVRGPARFAPMRYLFVHVLRWPKGRLSAPDEMLTTRPKELDSDVSTLIDLIERFADTPSEELAPRHPLFGEMTHDDWDALNHRHLDHHLRQFGA